jgi:hypothetical protein
MADAMSKRPERNSCREIPTFIPAAPSKEACLSSRGLERGALVTPRDFAFVIADFQVLCSKLQAAFLSPRVYDSL